MRVGVIRERTGLKPMILSKTQFAEKIVWTCVFLITINSPNITNNMSTIKIFDCSENSWAPSHRVESMGPVRNDVMVGLMKYSTKHNFEYVGSWLDADVIITNTVFSPEMLKSKVFKVKRMDGIYWNPSNMMRNDSLNKAAEQADLVIFISKYSQDTLHALYPDVKLKAEVVVINDVDSELFYKKRTHPYPETGFQWVAAASSWSRPEKRFSDILKFAEFLETKGEKLILIGKIPDDTRLPSNVNAIGYISDYKIFNNILNNSDGFVNFSYRDAGCKCVRQAMRAGLPVLYANSGGLPELVGGFGQGIKDDNTLLAQYHVPVLYIQDIIYHYELYKLAFRSGRYEYHGPAIGCSIFGQYFSAIRSEYKYGKIGYV